MEHILNLNISQIEQIGIWIEFKWNRFLIELIWIWTDFKLNSFQICIDLNSNIFQIK
jgi:hypothetical protein